MGSAQESWHWVFQRPPLPGAELSLTAQWVAFPGQADVKSGAPEDRWDRGLKPTDRAR
jgi:hypothetical protein